MTDSCIADIFEGIVSRLPSYEHRPQQVEMASLIADALGKGEPALIEAGTGSGKSFAYLVPLIARGERAVIATGTIALQEQLLYKDIPFLQTAMGRSIRVALAKGRSNYLCINKMMESDRRLLRGSPQQRQQLKYLTSRFRQRDWDGDRATLPLSIDGQVWSSICSDGLECFGQKCGYNSECPLRNARKELEKADIIIANHALYLTDLAEGARILPQHSIVVFDEAHHLDKAAISAFSVSIGRHSASRLLQRIEFRTESLPQKLVTDLMMAESRLQEWIARVRRDQFRLEPDDEFLNLVGTMSALMAELRSWMGKVDPTTMNLFAETQEIAKAQAEVAREQLLTQIGEQIAAWDHFADTRAQGQRVNWVESDRESGHFELKSAPLDPAPLLAQQLWSQKTSILTSATLAANGGFDYIRRQLGITEGIEKVLGSPFDFEEQATLLLPRGLPNPNDPGFNQKAAPVIAEILRRTRGRAFVLFTSYKALREISQAVAPLIPFEFRSQGDLPRSLLIDWFKRTPNSVLFATATFWEGVDIPGDDLSCVVIDRLPFAPPDDPINQARIERLKAEGEDWFTGYVLPRAIISLKQGFGRLIRTRTDRGVVAILDPRLRTKEYGEVIVKSLPPAKVTVRMEDIALG